MNVMLLSIALVTVPGSPLVVPVGDHVPVINVEETCKATAATNKAMNLNFPRPVENCMRDETQPESSLCRLVDLSSCHA